MVVKLIDPSAVIKIEDFLPGADVRIGARTQISAIGGAAKYVTIGDNVSIGEDVRIIAPRVSIGDYTVIHNHTTIYGYDQVELGECSWIGQNVILNSTAPLKLGRGSTISAYSSIWTHFTGGDPVEGCRYDSRQAASLGDDVWIGVGATVAPVKVGAKALVLAGGVVTKDIPANTTWGGNPAVDLTEKLGAPYVERSVTEKFEEMCRLLRQHLAEQSPEEYSPERFTDQDFQQAIAKGDFSHGGIRIMMADLAENSLPDADQLSTFDVRDRRYSKLRTPQEIAFMQFLLPKVKFWPQST